MPSLLSCDDTTWRENGYCKLVMLSRRKKTAVISKDASEEENLYNYTLKQITTSKNKQPEKSLSVSSLHRSLNQGVKSIPYACPEHLLVSVCVERKGRKAGVNPFLTGDMALVV